MFLFLSAFTMKSGNVHVGFAFAVRPSPALIKSVNGFSGEKNWYRGTKTLPCLMPWWRKMSGGVMERST